jgi:hypothetical protein
LKIRIVQIIPYPRSVILAAALSAPPTAGDVRVWHDLADEARDRAERFGTRSRSRRERWAMQ